MSTSLELKNITKEKFSQYGVVLDHYKEGTEYEAVVTVESRGWIWAILTFDWKNIKTIQNHPTSRESFEPVFGTTVIVVAPNESPEKLEAFLLDVPVCLHQGVWHQVMALSARARVKITENNDVTSENIELEKSLKVVMTGG